MPVEPAERLFMASSITSISDVIVPSVFEKYVIEASAEKSEFVQSGIVEQTNEFDMLAAGAGTSANLPFWNDLSGDRQPLSDSTVLETQKVGAGNDIARIHNDGQAWSVNQLASLLSGDDPMNAIRNLIGGYWARQNQYMLISSLKGIFSAASMASNLLSIAAEATADVAAATRLTGSTFIDACAKLGDRADQLTAVAMHSDTEAALRKLDLIDFIQPSAGAAQIRVFQRPTRHH